MMTLLAIFLLITRVWAIAILTKVIKTQRELMRRPIDQEITMFRRHLSFLTVALAASNLVPIILDIFIVLKGTGVIWHTVETKPLLIIYVVSNALAALLAAYLISRIYKSAVQVDNTHVSSDHTLMND